MCGMGRSYCRCVAAAVSTVFLAVGVLLAIFAIVATGYAIPIWGMDADGLFHAAILSILLSLVSRKGGHRKNCC